ncbi:MAG: ATP-dependent nuclease subunit B-like protein [Acidobacteria bacterium]|nr:ATP-dependent nuclease subunit B-like protein [Acidobacteriota bacterium]
MARREHSPIRILTGGQVHHIFTGTFAALEARFVELARRQQEGDPLAPVAVLVGSNLLASYLKRRIAETGGAAANLHFLTFLDLARKLGSPAPSGGSKPDLPHLGASLFLEDVLERNTPEAFARVAGFAGFRGAVLDTFRDLRDAGVMPSSLESSIAAIRGLAPDRQTHLRSLARIYRLFKARISAFRDSADEFRQAGLAAGAAPRVLGTRSLLIYGIYDVTGVQADLLHSLKDALDLTYFIPFVDKHATRFAAPFLEARSRELEVAPEELPQVQPKVGLHRLAARIFAPFEPVAACYPLQPLVADGSFTLVSVPGESRAAVEVIREVLAAVQQGLIRGFHEAAVILRQPDEEAPVLTEAFRLRGIPYYLHGGSAFSRRPLSQAILAIAGLESEAFSRRAVLKAMDLVAAALPPATASAWDVPQWRLLTNDPRFLAGVAAWDAATESLVREARGRLRRAEASEASGEDPGDEEYLAHSVPAAQNLLDSAVSLRAGWIELRKAAADWPEACSWQEWARLLQERLEPILGKSADWPAFSPVLDVFHCLGRIPDDAAFRQAASRARMAAALLDALADLASMEGAFERRGVTLLSAAAARGLRFPLVILPGLEEGRFPARLRQDPLLLDSERQKIGRPSRLPLKSLRGEEEKLLFDMAVRSADRRLVLMTSRLDEASDRERIPSQFFLRCAAAARGATVGLQDLTPEEIPGLRSASLDGAGPPKGMIAVDEGEIRLGLIAEDPGRARAVLAEFADVEPGLLRGPMAYDRARWERRLTGFDGRLLDAELVRSVAGTVLGGQVSASRIEEYAKCPYLFYLRRVQRLEKWREEEPFEGLDPLVRGQVIHAILEEFLRDFAGGKFAGTSVSQLQQALSEKSLRALEEVRPAAMPDLLWEIERDRLLAMLRNWLEFEKERENPGCPPMHLERSFGTIHGEAISPAYRVEGRGAAFEFRGRIDRIDGTRAGGRARVIDYKTGTLPRSMSGGKRTLLMAGEKIQLAVYCGALSVMEDLAGTPCVEGEYLHLQPGDGQVLPCSYGDLELREAVRRLPEMLEIIREGMEGGVFFARSRGSVRPEGHCRFCDYLAICGKDRERRESDKSADPAVLRFARLKEIDGAEEEEP